MPNLEGGATSYYDYVTKRLYFAKNVGLIRSEAYLNHRIDGEMVADTVNIYLDDYFIADE